MLNEILNELLTENQKLTDNELKLLLMHHMEKDPNLLYEKIVGNMKLITSARVLEKMGIVEFYEDSEQIMVSDDYINFLTNNNLIDFDGNLTERGKQLIAS